MVAYTTSHRTAGKEKVLNKQDSSTMSGDLKTKEVSSFPPLPSTFVRAVAFSRPRGVPMHSPGPRQRTTKATKSAISDDEYSRLQSYRSELYSSLQKSTPKKSEASVERKIDLLSGVLCKNGGLSLYACLQRKNNIQTCKFKRT